MPRTNRNGVRLVDIIARVALDQRHRDMLRKFREIDQSIPASATYFVQPTREEASLTEKVRNKGVACGHGLFQWEVCKKCGRTRASAQEAFGKLQRLFA